MQIDTKTLAAHVVMFMSQADADALIARMLVCAAGGNGDAPNPQAGACAAVLQQAQLDTY